MKIAPLIHSRTLYSDFNPNFAVRPADLSVEWAMSKILPSTRDIDLLNGFRRVVATDGKICIAGISCNFKMFAEKYLSADERDEAKKFFHDERGREVKIFLGYAFNSKDSGTPDVSPSKLWQMFKKTLAPKWELQSPETVIVPYDEECGTKNVVGKSFDKKFYPTSERDDIELFEQCLAARKDFCSNVDAVKIYEDGKYEIITASQNVISRLQAQKKTPQQSQAATPQGFASKVTEQSTQRRNQRPKPSPTEGKSGSTPLIIGVLAIILILAVIFLVMN